MIASLLTTLFFALSAVTASRSAEMLGPVNANFFRLLIAAVLLSLYAFIFGQGLQGPGMGIFLLSGFIGFGLGDVALFYAYRHIGARRGVLLAQCLAVPFAALAEWLWLGTVLDTEQCGLIALILLGVGMAVSPAKDGPVTRGKWMAGIACGVVAGLGQAWGAVLSRKAFAMNVDAGVLIDGWTAGFQRIWAGILVAGLFYAWFRWKERPFAESGMARLDRTQWGNAAGFCVANALAGPVLGVGCYQWALSGIPSGLVLAVVATTPLVVMPMSWFTERDRPSVLSMVGALLAVTGVVLLVA